MSSPPVIMYIAPLSATNSGEPIYVRIPPPSSPGDDARPEWLVLVQR